MHAPPNKSTNVGFVENQNVSGPLTPDVHMKHDDRRAGAPLGCKNLLEWVQTLDVDG